MPKNKVVFNIQKKDLNIEPGTYDVISFGFTDDPYSEWSDDAAHLGCFKMGIVLYGCKVQELDRLTIFCDKITRKMTIPDRRYINIEKPIPLTSTKPDVRNTMMIGIFNKTNRHIISPIADFTMIQYDKEKATSYVWHNDLEEPVALIITSNQDNKYITKRGFFTTKTYRQKNDLEEIGRSDDLKESVTKWHI